MTDTQWYARGELGDYVRDVVDAMTDSMISMNAFIAKLREVGMSDQEIMDVYAEDVLENLL